jgi:hypothetical protein
LWESNMYKYASDGPVELQDCPALNQSGDSGQPGRENSDYVVLTVALPDIEITWCRGPGISTIFAAKRKSPHDSCVLSRRCSA